jgi:hypothetical protein
MLYDILGGGDNANKTVLGFCEYLVAKRLVGKLVLTRLPVGHTHEDIDAVFGNLASWFLKSAGKVLTPQEYKRMVEEKFGTKSGSNLNMKVILMCVCFCVYVCSPVCNCLY